MKKFCQFQYFKLFRYACPVKLGIIFLNLQRNINVHPQSCSAAVQMLCQMADGVNKMEVFVRCKAQPLVRHGVLPRIAEIFLQICSAVKVAIHQVGVDLVILRTFYIGKCRFPVVLNRIAKRLHKLVRSLAVTGVNQYVNVTEGAHFRRRPKSPQVVTLHRHMLNSVCGKRCRKLLEIRDAVHASHNGSIKDRVQPFCKRGISAENFPLFIFICQHRQHILLRGAVPKLRGSPFAAALGLLPAYKAPRQCNKLRI